ncbi:hypothetical protein XELAEV_18016167mg [Xenopus laevis]|uniref:Uncharacterized protein n=1 Tax=Xenopus laevis TaxID=8355 RepID=A0A974DJJ6_XENLA|nr:hypothetical protein XELAEV_18016167mg [Xenopus laevis]
MEGLLEGEDNSFYPMSYMRFLRAENEPYQFQAGRNEYNGHIEINDNILDMETIITNLPPINEDHMAFTETEERPRCVIVGKEFESEDVCGAVLYPPLAEDKNFLAANAKTRYIQVVEHEPSAILFRDFSSVTSIPGTIIHNILNSETLEESDVYDEDEEEEADENGDVFTDLPQYQSRFPGLRRSQCHPINPNGNIIFNFEDVCQLLGSTQSDVAQTLNEGERNNLMYYGDALKTIIYRNIRVVFSNSTQYPCLVHF